GGGRAARVSPRVLAGLGDRRAGGAGSFGSPLSFKISGTLGKRAGSPARPGRRNPRGSLIRAAAGLLLVGLVVLVLEHLFLRALGPAGFLLADLEDPLGGLGRGAQLDILELLHEHPAGHEPVEPL